MNSIRVRLTLLFILVTTLTLGVFGVYSQSQLSKALEARFTQLQADVTSRLQVTLPAPLWNFDIPIIERIIAAEMSPAEVRAIFVLDSKSVIAVGMVRNAAGKIVPSMLEKATDGVPFKVGLYPPGIQEPARANAKATLPLGQLIVYFSRDPIDAALRADLLGRTIEIFTIDIVLLLALILSLRMVFRPLARLRDALFDLAGQEGEDVKELPDTRRTEFDAVIKGFNQTLNKLKQVIQRRTQAEDAARASAAETIQALEKLRTAQEELVKSGKMAALGSLVAGISHELNTPLGNGLMAITTLRGKMQDFKIQVQGKGASRRGFEAFMADVDTATDIALRSLDRSAELVSSFKQIAVDQSTSNRGKFKLDALVHDVLTVLQPTLKVTPYRVETTVADDIELDSFPGSLGQVLTNLISNAILHGFDGRDHGLIRVQAEVWKEGHLLMRIKDDGKGIVENNLSKIFDPFFTTKLGQGGSGLGLHISLSSVTQILGGTLNVHSQVGVGTEFELDLPLAAPSTSKPPAMEGWLVQT